MECFDLIHPCLKFLLTNQLISLDSGHRALGGHREMKPPGCKAGVRTVKGSGRENPGVLASGARR